MNRLQAGLCIVLLPGLVIAGQASEAEFFNDDWESRVAGVSEGELHWQAGPVNAQTPRVNIEITVLPESSPDGWVMVSQCHEPLDPVPAAELVFTNRKVRKLRVLSYSGIEAVRVQGEQVEMSGITAGARLCVASEQQILHALPAGLVAVVAGPYQRRFLDGYYPQLIDISLHYPPGKFAFERLHPLDISERAGMTHTPGSVHLAAHVAGRLKFAFVLQPLTQ